VRRRKGFTLIEVLLAASLTAIVGLAVAHVLGVMHAAQKRVRLRGERRALTGSLERTISADLNALVPPGGIYASGLISEDQQASGSGEDLVEPGLANRALAHAEDGVREVFEARDRVTLAVLPAARSFAEEMPLGEGSILEVIYEIDEDPATEERGLIRRVTRVRNPAVGSEPEPPERLAEEVVGLDLSFWDGQDWTEVWDSSASDTLPLAIQLSLAVSHQGELFVYRVLVAPVTAKAGAPMEAKE